MSKKSDEPLTVLAINLYGPPVLLKGEINNLFTLPELPPTPLGVPISKVALGEVFPIPTFPALVIRIFSALFPVFKRKESSPV